MERHLHDPIEDHLVPLEPLDLSQVRSIDDLVRAMSKTAFTGRQLGEAADVLEAMARDRDCFVVMTLAGAMTVAKQGLVITELIDRGIVNAIVSTGALMAHGLVEATGRAHFRYNPEVSDERLYEQGYNRVYDTLEPEQNLDDVEKVMFEVLEQWDPSEMLCSYKLNHAIGQYLGEHAKGQRGILKSAFEKGVPVFVPAFTDSELGLDVALSNRMGIATSTLACTSSCTLERAMKPTPTSAATKRFSSSLESSSMAYCGFSLFSWNRSSSASRVCPALGMGKVTLYLREQKVLISSLVPGS